MNLDKYIVIIKNKINTIYKKEMIFKYEKYLDKVISNKKWALLSYLTYPLSYPIKKIRFSNDGIALSIPRALNELGYSVDIVDWDNLNFIPKKEYDLFFGHAGGNFRNIYKNLNKNATVICFLSANHYQFSNQQEEKRYKYLTDRHGVSLPLHHFIYDTNIHEFSYSVSDGMICLGDSSILKTYSKFPLVLNLNNASYPDNHYETIDKDFEKIRNNFLFFAGGGNVHKGLDLLLDAFAKSDKNLYICTVLEPEFRKLYRNELKKSNIHFMGWVKPRSKRFYQIMDNCTFIIFPSCSEGSAGSVVESMNQGLIPIVSRETRIDVTGFGLFLNECTVEEINKVVEEVSNKPLNWIKEKSLLTRKAAVTDFSEENFIKNMKYNIAKIIEVSKTRSFKGT
jgi:glycosyltransferase involved in cell wall biosynthesis